MKTILQSLYTIKMYLCSAVLILLCGACTKNFKELNTNPNEATNGMLRTDNLSTGAFLVQMQKNVFPIAQQPDFGDEVYQTSQNLAGDVYSGYMGASNNWFSGANNTTYALIPQWYGQAFTRSFISIMPAWKRIADIAKTETPQVYAIATIIKVEGLHRVADMYGPLPYTNFGNVSQQNKYDSQRDVYYKFFDELNEAIQILTDFNAKFPSASALANYDFIYGGNIRNWIKFANSLKLRLAMRIAYVDASKAKTEAESAVNNSVGVMVSASDIAALQHTSNFAYNHPLFIISNNFKDIRMGASIESYLKGYKDPRMSKYFTVATDGDYHGIRNGINIYNKSTYAEGPFSALNIAATTPITWLNPAEVYFLRAEGALRGWNMGSTVQSLYERGIRTSFELNGLSGSADGYIADSMAMPTNYSDSQNDSNSLSATSTITVKWDDGADFDTKLERIITQKWLAIYPDGQEAWSEFRRTQFPRVFPVVINNSPGTINTNTQIRRLPFPAAQYQNNAQGVTEAISLLGGNDNGGTKLWWDKK